MKKSDVHQVLDMRGGAVAKMIRVDWDLKEVEVPVWVLRWSVRTIPILCPLHVPRTYYRIPSSLTTAADELEVDCVNWIVLSSDSRTFSSDCCTSCYAGELRRR
ncbi:hypothetical protein TIFTF001_032135 [Ficus carica]|uniref:Uncharacterized protein n=1 Tax=Ficus carica TaxID=3494 RepID=A0AA88DWD1_FICCA|nr:hypothetical protein TIFTF001_032135 [Ficus carica]